MLTDEEPGEGHTMFMVDVYAIGVIMWQLYTKEAPFASKSVHKIMGLVHEGKRPHSKDASKEPQGRLKDLIAACWSANFSLRPQVADVFRAFEDEIEPSIASSEFSS